MNTVSSALYNDLKAARRSQAQAAKPVIVRRLTKAGMPSRMPDDTQRFHTRQEADDYCARLIALNPSRAFRFEITEEIV